MNGEVNTKFGVNETRVHNKASYVNKASYIVSRFRSTAILSIGENI